MHSQNLNHEPELLEAEDDGVFSPDDKRVLDENRRLRRKLISLLTEGDKLPEDKSEKAMLINLMNGLDSEIIGRTRLKVAAKANENTSNLTSLVAQALMQYRPDQHEASTSRILELPSDVKIEDLVPGETDIGNIVISIEEFIE